VTSYTETRLLPYSAEQLFALVADVGKYPEFLPWCVAARVRTATATEQVADLTIGFGPFRESFTSRVALEQPTLIQVRYENGPFKYLNNRWSFTPRTRPDGSTEGCVVKFFVDFEFRSKLLQGAIGVVFNEAERRMVNAFLKRAHDIYGAPRTETLPTGVPAT
jgi:coenzyme Q-binding protein COQ10